MNDINKIALDYINTPIVSTAKSKHKTRKALTNAYERLRAKYVAEKEIVDELRNEGLALQKKFDARKARMDGFLAEMKDVRDQLNHIDDLGEPETEDEGEEVEEKEKSEDTSPDPYLDQISKKLEENK